MYVIVHVAEITGPEKTVSLQEVKDDVTLRTLLDRCLDRVDKYLPENKRTESRHFWHNDRFLPFEGAYLRDVAQAVNVTLELRPDHYRVTLPRENATTYAIDPELTVAQAIDELMGKGQSCCYELLPRGGQPLPEASSLAAQDTLPYHARLSQKETELVVRRKTRVWKWSAALVAGFVLIGLLVGYEFARLAR